MWYPRVEDLGSYLIANPPFVSSDSSKTVSVSVVVFKPV